MPTNVDSAYMGPRSDEIVVPRAYHHGDLRAALIESAERRLRSHGVDALSVRDLARELGVSHGAPRRHFADRGELLDALATAGFVRLGQALRTELFSAGGAFPDRLRGAAAAFVAFAVVNPALFDLMSAGKARPGATSVRAASDAAFRPVVDLIERGQASGALDAGDPEEIGTVLYATMLGIATLATGGLIGTDAVDPLVKAAVHRFLVGAGN